MSRFSNQLREVGPRARGPVFNELAKCDCASFLIRPTHLFEALEPRLNVSDVQYARKILDELRQFGRIRGSKIAGRHSLDDDRKSRAGIRTVRSNSEPRSNSPVIGNLLTSFWRPRRVCSRIIYKNESVKAVRLNLDPARSCSFLLTRRFSLKARSVQFCAGK